MKAKLRAFGYGLLAVALQAALFVFANGLFDLLIGAHLGDIAAWAYWSIYAAFWLAIFFVPLALFLAARSWLERSRRKTRLKASLAEATSTSVRVAGAKTWTKFQADEVLALVVPDAIAAIDKTRRLLRLKAIGSSQDTAVEFVHIIGVTWRPGETRAAEGRQSLFRRFKPQYRTLAEHPSIRLEIATKGREPVLEYILHAAPRDRRMLERFYRVLERGTRVERFTHPVPTEDVLDMLPPQGSKYGFGWIETA